MSMSKRALEEREEEELHKRLADQLGITYDEFSELDWEIIEDASDDGFIYDYIIQFFDSSPQNILDKIEGLSKSNSVELGVDFFDMAEDEE